MWNPDHFDLDKFCDETINNVVNPVSDEQAAITANLPPDLSDFDLGGHDLGNLADEDLDLLRDVISLAEDHNAAAGLVSALNDDGYDTSKSHDFDSSASEPSPAAVAGPDGGAGPDNASVPSPASSQQVPSPSSSVESSSSSKTNKTSGSSSGAVQKKKGRCNDELLDCHVCGESVRGERKMGLRNCV